MKKYIVPSMKKEIYKGRIITLYNEEVKLPSGRVTKLDIVSHPGAAAIVPVMDDGRYILLRQYRHASGGYLYEIPAGTLNKDEEPLDCAKRELIEETGYSAKNFSKMIAIHTTPGFSNEVIHLYKATGLKEAETKFDFDEIIEVEIFTRDEVERMIKAGKITDAKSLVGLLLSLI